MAAHQAPPTLGFSRQEYWSGLPFPSPMQESEKWKWSRSVVSDSQRPHGPQPTRLLHLWDFPDKSTGVGCHCLLRKQLYSSKIKWKWKKIVLWCFILSILSLTLETQAVIIKTKQGCIKTQEEFTLLAFTVQPLPQLPVETREDKGGTHIFWLTNVNSPCFSDFTQYNWCWWMQLKVFC